jgi:hypothetical protein
MLDEVLERSLEVLACLLGEGGGGSWVVGHCAFGVVDAAEGWDVVWQ